MLPLSDASAPDVQTLDAVGFFFDRAEEGDSEAVAIVARFEEAFPEFADLLWDGDTVVPQATGAARGYMATVRDWIEVFGFVRWYPDGPYLIEDLDLIEV